ncbi:hypothetical protein VTL71DRAFT_1934 [Oculimacula yallundae]|uniref:Carboxylesterase type B domain-containing protein n=1 Tax=Oculimacula yallundae TaxID=86028 RepID=A0ABR4CC37_9HELO
MYHRSLYFFLTLALLGSCTPLPPSSPQHLPISHTSSGHLHGFVNPAFPDVHQFLGIPFAHQPVGARRFLPPSRFYSHSSIVNATNIGVACPQQLLDTTPLLNGSVFASNGGNRTEFFPDPKNSSGFGEECLTLNVWAPARSTSTCAEQESGTEKEGLPVIIWYFGGGFIQGGTSALYFNPQSWVQRSQEHIVVTVNFRSNIFGFPNSRDLRNQNLGLMDQRMALEWTRDNIARFGGDPSRIVDWGESAGAIAADLLNFAYPDDPIVHGRILDSGTVFFPSGTRSIDTAQMNFSGVAAEVGCSHLANTKWKSEIECMRSLPWQNITAAAVKTQELRPPLNAAFLPVVDEKIVFANYTHRFGLGAFSDVPYIIGSNQHELAALQASPPPTTASWDNKFDETSNATFLCNAATASKLRTENCRTTYRYRYDGDFRDVSPEKYAGAYHSSELPLLFGTAGLFHGEATEYELEVGREMQDLWVEFAKDPEGGLEKAGWPKFDSGMAVLIGGVEIPVDVIQVDMLDGICGNIQILSGA